MYTNKELANALTILKNECSSHKRCLICPLYIMTECRCMIFNLGTLEDDIIKELGERDG